MGKNVYSLIVPILLPIKRAEDAPEERTCHSWCGREEEGTSFYATDSG